MSPPSLATRARRVLEEACLPTGTRVLVACSGGPDSQALLDTLAHVGKDGRLELFAHGVDHGLRPEASGELSLAEHLARSHGIQFTRAWVDLRKGSNLMARARDVRWESLEAAAYRCKASWIATAHHWDDLAETVLIRILRGAPLQGLAVLPVVSFRKDGVNRIRPLIGARRVDIEYHLKKRNIPFATDPSNNSPKYLRARVRNEVLPLLRSLDPKIVDHLANLAEEAFVEFGCQDVRLNEVEDEDLHGTGSSDDARLRRIP